MEQQAELGQQAQSSRAAVQSSSVACRAALAGMQAGRQVAHVKLHMHRRAAVHQRAFRPPAAGSGVGQQREAAKAGGGAAPVSPQTRQVRRPPRCGRGRTPAAGVGGWVGDVGGQLRASCTHSKHTQVCVCCVSAPGLPQRHWELCLYLAPSLLHWLPQAPQIHMSLAELSRVPA